MGRPIPMFDFYTAAQALAVRRETYEASKAVTGNNEEYDTLVHCNNLLHSLVEEKRIDEATSLARENIPLAVASLGPGNDITLKMRYSLARALSRYDASLEDRSEAVTILEDVCQTARQVFGAAAPRRARSDDRRFVDAQVSGRCWRA